MSGWLKLWSKRNVVGSNPLSDIMNRSQISYNVYMPEIVSHLYKKRICNCNKDKVTFAAARTAADIHLKL